jgi:hypothetical protein
MSAASPCSTRRGFQTGSSKLQRGYRRSILAEKNDPRESNGGSGVPGSRRAPAAPPASASASRRLDVQSVIWHLALWMPRSEPEV